MRLGFVLSQTFKGIKSNRIVVASLSLVTFLSLLFLGAAWLLQMQVGNMKDEWYDKVELSAFMCPDNSRSPACAAGEASQEQIDAVEEYLNSEEMDRYVDSYFIESKEEAYENFQKQMEGTTWVNAIDADAMQVSFRIKLVDPEEYEIVSDQLTGFDGVEIVLDMREQLQPVFNMLNGATVIAGGVAVTMMITALLLIVTMVRLSAMFRAKDTAIMRSVGASNGIIQAPFVLEGVFAALIGSALASATLWAGIRYIFERPETEQQFAFVNLVDTENVFFMLPWLVGGALLLTAIASFIALRRYTKV